MSTEKKTPSMEVEVSVDGGRSSGVVVGQGTEPAASSDFDDGTTLEFDGKGGVTNLSIDRSGEGEEQPGAAGEEPPTEGAAEEPDSEAPAELGEFDPSNADTLKAYEDKLFTFDEEGNSTFNMEAVAAEWEANSLKEGAEGGSLSEDTYKAITHFTGVSKEAIKEIEAGRVALREKANEATYAVFGGKEKHDAAFEWATTGNGYTAEQKAVFNEAAEKGGTALTEALALLATRFSTANPEAKAPATRRPAAPSRSSTARTPAAASPSDTYASSAEYEADVREKGNRHDPAIRAKLARSTYWR